MQGYQQHLCSCNYLFLDFLFSQATLFVHWDSNKVNLLLGVTIVVDEEITLGINNMLGGIFTLELTTIHLGVCN